jgi:hypothetical protein
MRKRVSRRGLALGLLAAALGAPAAGAADPPQEIGGAKGWTAYAYDEKKGKVCFLTGHPETTEPDNVSRGRIDILITHRPGEHALNVVQIDMGYPFKEGANVDLEVNGRKFALFTDKESAWAPDAAADKQVTLALSKAKRAVVKGTSARGTATTDVYELDGFAEALAAIDKACKVKR